MFMPQRYIMKSHSIKINKTLYGIEPQMFAEKAYTLWWTKLRDNYTLDEFFTYSKSNDLFLTAYNISNYN